MKNKKMIMALGMAILLIGCGNVEKSNTENASNNKEEIISENQVNEIEETKETEATKENEESVEETVEEVSQEQLTYEAAIEAEEKGYYKVAEKLYSSIKGYEDASEKYDNIKTFLAQYDGTYYGESTKYKNVYVYLYISDGIVKAQFEGQDISSSEFELYKYGTLPNGEPFVAFGYSISDRYSANHKLDYEDGVAIRKQDDGSYFLAPIEGCSIDTWNGFYDKIK